jgi:Transposase DDE domain group 1
LVTSRPGSAVELDADHRRYAVVEVAIRDLKDDAGLCHCPSGVFLASAVWALVATLAHNLLRWVAALGLDAQGLVVAKTVRRRLLTLPGLTSSARRRCLHPAAGWPWAQAFTRALARLRPCRPGLGCRPQQLGAHHQPVGDPLQRHQQYHPEPGRL